MQADFEVFVIDGVSWKVLPFDAIESELCSLDWSARSQLESPSCPRSELTENKMSFTVIAVERVVKS